MMVACMSGTLLGPGALASAEMAIYRYEDAQGISVFVDRPGPGRQEIDLPTVNTYTPAESTRLAATATGGEATEIYQALLIDSPGDGETIRRNGGNVRVTGRIEPDLRADHRVVAFVDGAPATLRPAQAEREHSRTEARSVIDLALSGLARGPHTLHIAIVDPENNILIQSEPVGFHLLRAAARGSVADLPSESEFAFHDARGI